MDDVTERYRDDLRGNAAEFPITTMSSVLAAAINELLSTASPSIRHALDVGTGSGIHAAILATSGVSEVLAIDISQSAIEGAAARFQRILSRRRGNAAVASPDFEVLEVDGLEKLGRTFQLVVTNPPSFFQPSSSDPAGFNPVESGVYDGERGRWRDPTRAFLYRALNAVDIILEPSGFVLCTWPGLERRLAHDLQAGDEPVVHPTALLGQWFGWQFSNAPLPSDWREFYVHRARITDYGLGESFLANLSRDVQSGRYSDLVHAPWNTAPTFDFGLLALQRDGTQPDLFHVMDLPASSSAGGEGS